MDRDAALATRLATQRLTGPAASPAQVVRELLCIQAQDAPLARAMIALRGSGETDSGVRAAVGRGELVRTHVLRPTWHYVAAADLRWLLRLTSPKVESGMAARHRQLELDERRLDAGLDVLAERLAARRFANRTELGVALAEAGVLDRADDRFGQQAGHLLLVAELRAVICSAPVDGSEHRYALADEVLPAGPRFDRAAAVAELVGRFVCGHGPVALADLTRWARVTLGEARSALSGLDELVSVTVDGEELWYSPAAVLPETRPAKAWLLSVFDEAFLSYRRLPWPRSAGHPAGDQPYRFAESGGGVVLCGLKDVGAWKRTRSRGTARIELVLDESLSRPALAEIDAAVDRLLAIIE